MVNRLPTLIQRIIQMNIIIFQRIRYLKIKPTLCGFLSHARFMQPFTISWLSLQCWCIVVFITFAYHATCLQKYFLKRIDLRLAKHLILNTTYFFRFYTTYSMIWTLCVSQMSECILAGNLKIELRFYGDQ